MVKESLYLCPHCGGINLKNSLLASPSDNVRPSLNKINKIYLTSGFPRGPDTFICLDCDYYGVCPKIDDKDIDKFKKQFNKK